MARKPDPEARPKLVAAARKVFGEVGVDAARIEDIAREAGISKGSFYLHFSGKDALFDELLGQFFAVLADIVAQRNEAFTERIGAAPAALAELEHAYTVRSMQAMWRHRDVLRAVLDHGGLRGRIIEHYVGLGAQTVATLVQGTATTARSGIDADLASELVVGMWLQLARRMVRAPARPDFDLWARTVASITAYGLAGPPDADPAVKNSTTETHGNP